jgi:MFS superfamily sulfate permease-like transporter
MDVADPIQQHSQTPRRGGERVVLRPSDPLDAPALSRLEREATELVRRGCGQLTIDLGDVETIDWTTAATLAAINRCARRGGTRVNVVPGNSPAVRQLLSAGPLRNLTVDSTTPTPFFDWSR